MRVEGLERKTCSRSRAFESRGRCLAMLRIVTHGSSGHARFNIPDVPGLRDRSAIVGNLDKLDSAVVIYLCNPHWIQVCVGYRDLCGDKDQHTRRSELFVGACYLLLY